MKWRTVKLGDIAEFKNGVNYNKNNLGTGIRVVNVADFKDYFILKYDSLNEINPDGIVSENSLLQNGDILFVRSNGNKELVGRTIFIANLMEPITYSAFCIRTRFIDNIVCSKFFAYYFRTDVIRRTLSAYGTGTNITNLNQSILGNLEVPVPPLEVQERVSSILSAYDDLIDNNLRRIKLLEESAQLIYTEWFINLRFPGYEHSKIVDGVPVGWERKTIESVLEYSIGGGWGKDDYELDYNNPAFVIRGTDIPKVNIGEFKDIPYRYHSESNLKSRILLNGDIVFEVSGGSKGQPVGRILLISDKLLNMFSKPVICASFCKLIRTKQDEIPPEYLYLYLADARSSGVISVYENQSASNIVNFRFMDFISKEKLFKSTNKILDEFVNLIRPLINQIYTLSEQNQKLKQARDILLPRLMDGGIEV